MTAPLMSSQTTTTAGATSSHPGLRHTEELVERHKIVVRVPADRSRPGDHPEIIAEAERRAKAWAEAHGLEISNLGVYAQSPSHPAGPMVGVVFDVHIGHGVIDPDQSTPGALDTWTWSARFQYVRRLLNGLTREGRRLAVREDGLASVSRLSRDSLHTIKRGGIIYPPDSDPDEIAATIGQGFHTEGDLSEYGQAVKDANGGVGFEDAVVADGPARNMSEFTLGEPEPADQRPPWLRRADGWDEVGGDWSGT